MLMRKQFLIIGESCTVDPLSQEREESVVDIVRIHLIKASQHVLILAVNRDDYISRWRNTNFSKEEVLEQIL